MHESSTWVIPTFNFELRTAKPVMLYWLQRGSYAAFGVSEWSARLPSAIAASLTLLLVYELGRRMFGRLSGLLGSMILASAVEFSTLAHAATPDATLLFFTTLTFYLFWIGHMNGSRAWWLPSAFGCGLAALTKGPVGIALPGLVILAYFAWNRQVSRLFDRRLFGAIAVGLLVAGPWYGLVTAETRGQWTRAFFGNENVNRFINPMENHSGPIVFHALALFVFFAPWSVFMCGAIWYSIRWSRGRGPSHVDDTTPEPAHPYRFLLCWVLAYLVVFSLAATKLPNYVLPLYPALALLTARFLVRWRQIDLPRWLMPTAIAGMVLVAATTSIGLLVAGGVILLGRSYHGLGEWAWLGLIPLAGALGMAWCLRGGNRAGYIAAMTLSSLVFVGIAGAFPTQVMDQYKAPRHLVADAGLCSSDTDLQLAAYDWFQPSAVFYSRRRIERLATPEKAAEFLAIPTPRCLLIPESTWQQWVMDKVRVPWRVAARRFDFYRNCDILVIANGEFQSP